MVQILCRWLLVVGVVTAGAAFGAETLNSQEAIARLAQERTQAIACMALLKKCGGASAIDRGALVYGEAKGEYDAITQELLDAFNDPAADLAFSVPRPHAHLGCDRA